MTQLKITAEMSMTYFKRDLSLDRIKWYGLKLELQKVFRLASA